MIYISQFVANYFLHVYVYNSSHRFSWIVSSVNVCLYPISLLLHSFYVKWTDEHLYSTFTGRGVYATEGIAVGSFIVLYPGTLISAREGSRRERVTGDSSVYRFFINWRGRRLWYEFFWLFLWSVLEWTSFNDWYGANFAVILFWSTTGCTTSKASASKTWAGSV